MAAQRRAGLDDDTVDALRAKLAEGGRPRVALSGPQFPDATVGTVVRVGDPANDGEDFVVVRVKVNGHVDELGFAPNELSLPGTPRTQPASPRRRPVRRREAPPGPPMPLATRPAPEPTLEPTTKPAATPAGPSARSSVSAAVRTPKRRKGGAPAKVTITLSSDDSNWSVSASRGARSLCRATPVAPGVLTAVAALLENAEIVEAVADINDVARLAAEERAARLRVELAELDAVLASHRSPAT
jgi:hypothetical protein